MPYPRHLINEGETVALDLHPHWWYFSKHILTGIPLFLALIGVLMLSGGAQTVARWARAILAGIWAGRLAIKDFQWQYTHLAGTDARAVFRTGLLSRHGGEVPPERGNH